MRIRLLTFIALLCLMSVFSVFAQDTTTFEGELTAETPALDYELELEAGTTVVLTAAAADSDLDPYLFLYHPSGALVTANDDAAPRGGDLSARITYEVEESGTYTARVRGFGDAATGAFALTVTINGETGALIAGTVPYASLPQSRTADGAFVLGDPNAPITLIVYSDWACPHCQVYHETVEQFLLDYVVTGQAQFEMRTVATAGGELTRFASSLAECADNAQPGAFWEAFALYYEYAAEGSYDQTIGQRLADDLDLSYADLLTCSSDAAQWRADLSYAQTHEVTGTPTVMVRYGAGEPTFVKLGDRVVPGGVPLDVLAELVEAAQPAGN